MPNNESVINNKDAKINKRVVSGVIVLKVFPCSMRVYFLRLFHRNISFYMYIVNCILHIGKVIKNVKHLTPKGMGGAVKNIFENWFWFGCIRTLTPFFSAHEHRRNSIEVSIS